ncbi:hypothetical protein F5Y19DRAFT_425059 [Xylariaceae sp. FL1651]|nr:hypothetical protein F5Y19DRAFT_425059 [Xylariaceae sp. FL1651]
MADSSCGPSNAFKGLARHIEQDRSHQQDRVVAGSQPGAQNFRSSSVDAAAAGQFASFQQQNAALPQYPAAGLQSSPPAYHRFGPAPFPSHPAQLPAFASSQSYQQPAGFTHNTGSSWVNDFQRMNFSDAHARPVYNHHTQGPTVEQPTLAHTYPHQAFQSFQPQPVAIHPIGHNFGASQVGNDVRAQHQMDENLLTSEAQARLDQEFEDLMNDWMIQNGPQADKGADELKSHNDTNQTTSPNTATSKPVAEETTKEDSAETQDTDTELARAAQQLVDSVSDNGSDKFKNSEFLALMRRIASQQLTVQGNDLVEAPQPSSTETGSGSHVTGRTSAATPTTTSLRVSTILTRW